MAKFWTVIKDRIKEVRDGIVGGHVARDVRLEEAGERVALMLLEAAVKRAPDGSREESLDRYSERYGQRVSVDRYGVLPIAESLTREVTIGEQSQKVAEESVGEVVVSLYTSSFHTVFFTEGIPKKYRGGTKPHRVPTEGMMWERGHPLSFHYQGEDRNVWTSTDHPGIDLSRQEYGDFVLRAYADTRNDAQEIVREAARRVVGDGFDGIRRRLRRRQ